MQILKKLRRYVFAFLFGIAFAVLCFVVLNAAMVPLSKSQYCGGKCHEMNTAYRTWEISQHGAAKSGVRTECVDCHLPPKDEYFSHIVAKAYAGAKDIYMHHFGPEYDIEKIRKKVLAALPSRTCLNCHDDLLARPSNSAARFAHIDSITQPKSPKHRCVECHENTGHERQNKLFSP